MDIAYSEQLKELMTLIIDGAPKPEMVSKAKELKIQLSKYWAELQRVMILLDSMVSQYAPEQEWIAGFESLQISQLPPQVIHPQGIPSQEQFGKPYVLLYSTILENARKLASNGMVKTAEIVKQAKIDGDTRPEKDIAISVGNILVRNGWERVYTGLYKLKEKLNDKEEGEEIPF